MELKLSITTEKVLKWSLLSLAFTPLVVTSFVMFPFVVGKTVFVRLMIALFWVILSIALLARRKNRGDIPLRLNFDFIKNPLFISLFSFMILGVVSTIFSTVPGRAFFGTLERGEGYIHILFLFFFVIGALLVFRSKEWFSFFKLTILTGIIVSGDVIVDFLQSGGEGRPNGSFINNPAFIASYLLFALFAAFVILSVVKKRSWRYLSYLTVLLSFTAIAVTNTRGILIGLFAGIFAVAVYFVWKGGSNKVRLLRKDVGLKTVGGIVFVSSVPLELL